jgi:hypothetical protein
MPRRQVEVVYQIATGIGVAKNASPWIDGQLKNKTPLIAFTSGMHANFHHASPHEATVTITRKMTNGVKH